MVTMPSPQKRPTIKDVAAAAGVAAMTVSYTFNKPDRVAQQTRAKVLAAADALGYRQPDRTARALRTGRAGQIGVVFGEHLSYAFDDPQASAFLAGVSDVCVDRGLGMVLLPTHGGVDDVDRVLGAGVDGYVLWTTTEDDPVLAAVSRSGLPAAIQGGPTAPGIAVVGGNDAKAARAVAAAALGHGDDVMILSFPLDQDRVPLVATAAALPDQVRFPVTRQRLTGYRQAIEETGATWDATPVAVVERHRRDQGTTAMRALLERWPASQPVVLAMSDELALGAHEALAAIGRTATVTGWDGSPAAQSAGIITVTNPLREQGRVCAAVALDPSSPVPEMTGRVRLPPHP